MKAEDTNKYQKERDIPVILDSLQELFQERGDTVRIHGNKSAEVSMLQDFGLGGVDGKLGSGLRNNLSNSADVICVCMGNHNKSDLEIQLMDITQDSACFSGCIDDHAVPGPLRCD